MGNPSDKTAFEERERRTNICEPLAIFAVINGRNKAMGPRTISVVILIKRDERTIGPESWLSRIKQPSRSVAARK